MDRKEKINKENFDILKEHYRILKKLFSLNDNDVLFISWQHIVRLNKSYIDFFIFNKLKTKKNNYTVRLNIWIYNSIIKKLWQLSNCNIPVSKKSTLKQELIKLIKGVYRVWKDDSVLTDEKVCMAIFENLKDFNFDYKIKTIIKWKKITIYYHPSKAKTSYYFFLYLSWLNSIDWNNIKIRNEFKDNPDYKILSVEIISWQKKQIKQNLISVLYNFFQTNYFKEEYYYITDIRSQREKDLSNTIELFNDVIQKWLPLIDQNIRFDDRQIIEINWKKLYYDKNTKGILGEMYLFRFQPLIF